MANEILVDIQHLVQQFPLKHHQVLTALKDISFQIRRGETFGLVGESGCGKTTCGRTILRIYNPASGRILYDGKDIAQLKPSQMKGFRKRAQMIYQDPYASLDPRMTIGEIIAEGMKVHFPRLSSQEMHDRINDLLSRVGLNEEHAARFPHELSGGQRQRIGIARALAVEPEFIVCDEPISALDVSIQAQIVNLLGKLQNELGLTYLFISHDLSMVKHISDHIGVMYLGKMVEITEKKELYKEPLHPYTQALISAIPVPDPEQKGMMGRIKLEGEVPSPINRPRGCPFSSRCRYATDRCRAVEPALREIRPGHQVACFLYGKEGQASTAD